MKVGVIGCGPSGLATIKELLHENHEVLCFEKEADIGGVFQFQENGQGVYDSCHLTSSTAVTEFSDFCSGHSGDNFMTHSEYFEYLKRYAEKFKLYPHISFNSAVSDINQNSDGKWHILVHKDGQSVEHIFDAVAICAGVHQTPSIPDYKGIDDFKGEIVHAGKYKRPAPFENKNVVMVGAGESGSDIVKEVSAVAKTAYLSLRRGVNILPRRFDGLPSDFQSTRLRYSLPKWISLTRYPENQVRRNKRTFGLLVYPILTLGFLLSHILRLISNVFKKNDSDVDQDLQKEMFRFHDKLREMSGAIDGDQFATKTEALLYPLADGSCKLKPGIKEFSEKSITFTDDTKIDADSVILCTGYVKNFPFLSKDINTNHLFHHSFSPSIGSSLCFIGIIRPAIGSLPVLAEMQARWFAQVCSRKVSLPSKESMDKTILTAQEIHRNRFKVITGRLDYLVDFSSYLDMLAKEIGCKPPSPPVLGDFKLFYKLYCGPFSAAQYRIRGPHSQTQYAIGKIKGQRVAFDVILNSSMFVCFILCRVFSFVGFKAMAPSLSLNR